MLATNLILNGQAEIIHGENGNTIRLHAGKYAGAEFGFADVSFSEDESEPDPEKRTLILRFTWFPTNDKCGGEENAADFKNYIGEILHYMLVLSTGTLLGSPFENFSLT